MEKTNQESHEPRHVTSGPPQSKIKKSKSETDTFTTLLQFMSYHGPTTAENQSERNTEIKHKSKSDLPVPAGGCSCSGCSGSLGR